MQINTFTIISRSLSCLYVIACLAGLIWQLYLVSNIYFSYKVTTKLQIEFPEVLAPQSTSFCVRNTDVLQFDRLNQQTGRNWSYAADGDLIRKYQEELTINEFFEFTPEVHQVISKIVFRKKGTYERFVRTGASINETFSITKYVYLEYICFRMWDRTASSMTFRSLAVTPTNPGMIYEIYLSEAMIRSNIIKISTHGRGNYPFRSLSVCPVMRRQYDHATGSFMYNMYTIYQVRITVDLLKPPFETMCLNYRDIGIDSDAHCIQSCIRKKTMQRYNMIPFGVIVNETLKGEEKDLKLVSNNNVANEIFGKEQLDIEEECGSVICSRKDCNVRTAITMVTQLMNTDVPVIGIRMNVPSDPWISVSSSPTLDLVEFLTYAMSCVSTWTGLSIMFAEPVSLFHKAKRIITRYRGRNLGEQSPNVKLKGQEEAIRSGSPTRDRTEMRRKVLSNITIMHHMASLSRRLQRLEEYHSNRYTSTIRRF